MISSRLKAQRHMLLVGFIINLLMIVIFLISEYLLLHEGLLFKELHPGLLLLLLFSLFTTVVLRNLYIKTSSLEVFFLLLLLFSLNELHRNYRTLRIHHIQYIGPNQQSTSYLHLL